MTQSNHPPRIALITGGSRGLGKSMALHMAEAGIDVVITYQANERAAQEVVASIQQKGRKAAALALDVGDSRSFVAFAQTLASLLERDFGRSTFDILVNNAGVGEHASFMETTEDQFDTLMRIHLKGAFFLSQKLVPMLVDGGRVLNVSSGLTRFSFPGYSAYAAMKGGVEVLSRYMAKELGARGISVNTLAPGAIETDFGGGAVRDNEPLNKAIAAETALGRVGLPDDIGGLVALLVAPASRWINGQRIEASGGMLL